MADSTASPASLSPLARVEPRLVGTAAVGGLLGGLVMFLVMAGYNASAGMGFLTILNVCFAAWVFRGTAMTTAMAATMNEPLSASHIIVGGLLHLAMSAFAGAAFAVVLALLIRAGVRVLATPAGYVTAAAAGGALLYVIMLYGFAPLWNTEIVNFTPRGPFFLSHLLFGATVGGWVYWKLAHAGASIRMQPHRPGLHGA